MQPDTMFDDQALATVRRAYARQMLAVAGVADDPRLEEAFAEVPRERFLGPPPWQITRPRGGYHTLPSADPVLAYQDVLFALSPERGVNNGSPSLHASWLYHAQLKPGECVVHVGAGSGYYTALIARLVGETGSVTAVEFEPRLADLARTNLAHLPNVTIVEGDGATWPREAADLVYVNFSVERPARAWLENLGPGGRLVFPLGVPPPDHPAEIGGQQAIRLGAPRPDHPQRSGGRHAIRGAAFLVQRHGSADTFAARWLGPAFFVCAEGGNGELNGTEAELEALKAAFKQGGASSVRSLHWREPSSPDRSWFVGSGWSLSYEAAA